MSSGRRLRLDRHERPAPRVRIHVKLLLTSVGVSNTTIHDALVALLAKPISDCDALCIPTAEYGHPMCTPASAWRFVAGQSARMCGLGWRSVGLLELTALPTI